MPKKGLTIRCRSCKILNVRRELITPARQIEKQAKHSLLVFPRMSERPLIIGQFSGVGTGGSIALFTALQQDGALLSLLRGYEDEWSELPQPPSPPNRSPAKRVRFGKEEGGSGCGALPALTETGKAEWSELLLTPLKGRGQSGIGMEPQRRNRHRPVTLN